jgi:hypothetical protein
LSQVNKFKEIELFHTILKVIGVYILAKLFEHSDMYIFNLLQNDISGHTIKHLFAAFAIYMWFRGSMKLETNQ